MLVLLLVAGVVAILGVRALVDQVSGTARQLDRESLTVAALRTELVDHEQTAHSLLSEKPVDRGAFLRQQESISRQFEAAARVFPAQNGLRAAVEKAHQSWQNGLMAYGLWGGELESLHGSHAADNPTFGASSDATRALLDGLEGPSLSAMNRSLVTDADLERLLIVALTALFALALAVTAYFRRRMAADLVRPMATMHQGVQRLQAGDYGHRIEVTRLDELGELAAAFNGMASALDASHRDLTVRATHDSLTGLLNRASMTERLKASFSPATGGSPCQESVLFIDIDDFKHVNETLGHEGGDLLLSQLAARLVGCVRPHDLLGRLGGDEFAIMIFQDEDGSAAVAIAERICEALHAPFTVAGTSLTVAVSIGVAQRRATTGDAAELLRDADFAMYMAKGGGKGRYELYDAEMHDKMVDRSALKTDLASAVGAGQLRLDYQPIADLCTGEIVGIEALVRWQHPTFGLLMPARFIALAEATGDIDAIGCWVLQTAARQAARWRDQMPQYGGLWVSVNLSALQLTRPENLIALAAILNDPAVYAEHVVLEITETALADDVHGGIEALNLLKRSGARLAIDDFGTGFSSLHTLASLPVDIVKIDRSFVSGHVTAARSLPLLEGILGLADKLALAVIAEGIEEASQLDLLRTMNCPMGQGYLLARPTSASGLEAILAAGAPLVQATVLTG